MILIQDDISGILNTRKFKLSTYQVCGGSEENA